MGNGIIRRVDDLGRIMIPKNLRRAFKIKEGDPLEIFTARNGSIIIKPYRKSWEECALEWFENHISLMNSHTLSFIHSGDYTICTFWDEQRHQCWVGKAKRYISDEYDSRIGKVAVYARAMCIPINDLIGYED